MASNDIQDINYITIQKSYIKTCSQRGRICLEYVWIDKTREKLLSKTRVVDAIPMSIDDVKEWNFNGYSTGQAKKANSGDIYLKPVAMFMDPFLGGENRLVLCETILFDRSPIKTNSRHSCAKVMQRAIEQDPWFGIEQEYQLIDPINGQHLGWPECYNKPGPEAHYCGGSGAVPARMFCRPVAIAHLKACLHAGIKIGAINAQEKPSLWKYQIGPCRGIDIGDQVWMSRYILSRVASEFNVGVSFAFSHDIRDEYIAVAQVNFSSEATRDKATGLKAIYEAIGKLSKKHEEHIRAYDPMGDLAEVFSFGVADRNVCIRIPAQVNKDGYGYFEDRRPAANCDPYLVSELWVRTICLDE